MPGRDEKPARRLAAMMSFTCAGSAVVMVLSGLSPAELLPLSSCVLAASFLHLACAPRRCPVPATSAAPRRCAPSHLS